MTLKHTPGPWKRGIVSDSCSTGGDIAYIWPESNGHTLARVQGGNVTANSLLISAAPDLLAALQYVTDILSSSIAPDDYEPFRACISQARAAISKATGE
jgi:hypothetical protein